MTGGRITRRVSRQPLLLLCAGLLLGGCGRGEKADTEDPAQVLVRLQALHRQHSYKDMEPLVDPARSRVLINTLMAVDRLLLTAGKLQQTAEQKLGPTAAVVCDISSVADYLGPFSRQVQIVSTRREGDKALVVYQVGERVPIERAEVRRVGGRWLYVPDEPDVRLADLLMLLTERMTGLEAIARAGTTTEQAFIDEYARQVVTPLMSHLQEVDQQRAKASSQGPSGR